MQRNGILHLPRDEHGFLHAKATPSSHAMSRVPPWCLLGHRLTSKLVNATVSCTCSRMSAALRMPKAAPSIHTTLSVGRNCGLNHDGHPSEEGGHDNSCKVGLPSNPWQPHADDRRKSAGHATNSKRGLGQQAANDYSCKTESKGGCDDGAQ